MVQTTKGAADAPTKRAKKPAAEQNTSLQGALGFTDAEWDRVQMHANGSSSTPKEFIRRAVFLTVGQPNPQREDIPGHG